MPFRLFNLDETDSDYNRPRLSPYGRHEPIAQFEIFGPVPCFIAADWHMRSPEKNYGLLSPQESMGWLTLEDV